MPSQLKPLLIVGFIALIANGATATEIDGSCLVSFNVKDKTFRTGVATISCTALEARRVALFTQVNSLKSAADVDTTLVSNALEVLEARLQKLANESNWTGLTASVTGNALATYGLAACIESSAVGCAVNVIAKLLSVVGIVNSASSDAIKVGEVNAIRREMAAMRVKIQSVQSAKPTAASTRERLVAESVAVCADVKKYCLAN